MNNKPSSNIFQKRIVVFLDVLGFTNLIQKIQKEIDKNTRNAVVNNTSKTADNFLNIFQEQIKLIDENYKFYLFSDNICITLDYINNKEKIIDLIKLISNIYYNLALNGYFLRGGISLCEFFESDKFAIGTPLVKAYELENKAIHPRILVDKKFYNLFKEESDDNDFYIKKERKKYYINILNIILNTDDKIKFFKEFKKSIESKITTHKEEDKILKKFKWVANDYNKFIDEYIKDYFKYENEVEITETVLNKIKKLKISL